MAEQTLKRDRLLNFVSEKSIKEHYKLVNPKGECPAHGSPIEPVGKGGSGVVFRAQQDLHDGITIDRAVKFFMYRDDIAQITKHRYQGPISTEDFLAEITNIATFNHEYLVKVIDAGVYSVDSLSIPFIITDFIEGPTLRDIIEPEKADLYKAEAIEARKKFIEEPTKILELLLSLSEGLEHIHSHFFAHCDIAPKNVFLDQNQDLRSVIGDLGISKDLRRKRDSVFVAGTRAFMPSLAINYVNKEVDWETFVALHPHWDLFAFAKTGLDLLSALRSDLPTNLRWLGPLITTLKEVESGGKFSGVGNLKDRLEFLRPVQREVAAVPELSASVAGRARKLMPVEPLSLSRRTSKLIRHPAIVRLARVPQLTTAYQLFPGANHTSVKSIINRRIKV